MTAADYAASRPDLLMNWARAHNAAWVKANPASSGVAAAINSFSSLESYLANDYGSALTGAASVPASITAAVAAEVPSNSPGSPPSTVTPPPSSPPPTTTPPVDSSGVPVGAPVKGDPSHEYAGRANGNDIWRLTDAGGTIVQWQVIAGHDSRELIDGTLKIVGHTAAIADPSPVPSPTPSPTPTPTPSPTNPPMTNSPLFDPTHRFIGNDAQGRPKYILVDEGGTVIEWTDLGNGIAGDYVNLGPATASAATIAAQLLAQNPHSTTGGGSTGGTTTGGGGTAAPASNTNSLLLIAAAAALGIYFANR